MNRKEAIRQTEQERTLMSLGFTIHEAEKLRGISNTLHRWYELECGTGDGQVSHSIERDEETGKPFMRFQYPTPTGWHDCSYPTADREKGAIKRLKYIMAARHARAYINGVPPAPFSYYLQTDPRGAALYILRPGDIPAGADPSAYYSRGICVY